MYEVEESSAGKQMLVPGLERLQVDRGWLKYEKAAFLDKLKLVEDRMARVMHNQRLDYCRFRDCDVCHAKVYFIGRYKWSGLLSHYINDHMMKPTSTFIKFVNRQYHNYMDKNSVSSTIRHILSSFERETGLRVNEIRMRRDYNDNIYEVEVIHRKGGGK